jgi:hypothetical protein
VTPDEIKQLVSSQLQAGLAFENFHGITPENLRSFLVEPYEVVVDPDDLETGPRPMWVILHERRQPRADYVVVFDPQDSSWGIAEFTDKPALTLVVSGPTLAEALSSM